ncbi:MAG: PIN domain nuclease [Acidimicrobiaceae bacterium]|nr:PIN domain nuclease [Acidimicrobiaceae bacterium]MXW61283.1 PIN domain nuclease [Acidimicrobiaceae bacterium]MXW76929.1 PIN domain nuclease [Acidimicrobiaceae bacterium]MYC41618.1 PIN domain nuclease [Acidimicrobiaceae bacterium]MYD05592.1 PIN domain nuclease [Acidimicrobiaceae bacterium]
MARVTHLADTSAFARLSQPLVFATAAPLITAGRVALCAPVAFELGFSARNPDDHESIMSRLSAFESVPVTDSDHKRAIELQGHLAEKGLHRAISLVDALVAAVAEARQLIVLHYDADFELIAKITGQAHQWVVERGSADNEN